MFLFHWVSFHHCIWSGRLNFSETGVVGGEFSLFPTPSIRGGFQPMNRLKNVESGRKRGSVYARLKGRVQVQVRIFPVIHNVVQIRHLMRLCTSLVSLHLGCSVQQVHSSLLGFTDGNSSNFQARKNICWHLIVSSWTRSLTVRVTESGPRPNVHTMPSMKSENFMLPEIRLK